MTAELRYRPGERKIPLLAALRHHERYFRALKLLGRYGTGPWLDYGCGSGYGSMILRDFTDGMIYAYDLDQKVIRDAPKTHHVCFISDPVLVSERAPYDAIFMIEVLEHMSEEELRLVLKDMLKMLDKDVGKMVFSTPFCMVTNRKPNNPHHVVEWGWEDLRKLLRECGWITCVHDTFPVVWTDGTKGDQVIVLCQPTKNT